MIVVTVARKPMSSSVGSNVIRHGTGALNIDATRIEGSKGWPETKQYNPGFMAGGSKSTAVFQDSSEHPNRAKGRWPANLILQHSSDCVLRGVTEVSTRRDTRPECDGGREDKTQWRFRPTEATKRGYADEDGLERVDLWDCASGCPCKALDAQSGFLPSRGNVNSSVRLPPGGAVEWYFGPGDCGGALTYDQGGGASRFFRQVKP